MAVPLTDPHRAERRPPPPQLVAAVDRAWSGCSTWSAAPARHQAAAQRLRGDPGTGARDTPTEAGAAFHRAFERMGKAALRDMGIPARGRSPSSPASAESDVSATSSGPVSATSCPIRGLSPEEVAALHLAATQVRLEGGDATEAVWKLGGVPSLGQDPDGDRAGCRAARFPAGRILPEVLLHGVATERRARCTVHLPRRAPPGRGSRGGFEFRNGTWYLIGFGP